jgi:hypothetical protein
MIRVLSFYGQRADVVTALDDAAAEAEDVLNSRRGEVLDVSQSVVLVGKQFVVVLVAIVELDDLAA